MNELNRALLAQMNSKSQEFSEAEITEIVQQARQEALAEAKSIIRELMLQAILTKALECFEPADKSQPTADSQRVTADSSQPTTDSQQVTADSQPPATDMSKPASPAASDSTRAEIELLRKKIAENEQILQQIKAPPAPPVEAPAPPPKTLVEATGAGFYVFGVLPGDRNVSDLLAGVEGLGYPVYGLPYKDIQVAVCQTPLNEFGEEPLKANLEIPAWLEARVLGHQAVLEALSASAPVIPMKFCTIYLSENRALEAMAEYYGDFVENLQVLTGKQEWGVKLYYDPVQLSEQVSQSSPRVKQIQKEIAKKSEGVAYFARKKLDVAIGEEVERSGDQITQACHDRLSACAEKSRITPIYNKETTGRTDEMTLNGAYLVAIAQFDRFETELEALKTEYAPSGFSFELSGPWPPYNFVSLQTEATPAHE